MTGVAVAVAVVTTSGAGPDTLRPLPPAFRPTPTASPAPLADKTPMVHHPPATVSAPLGGRSAGKPPRQSVPVTGAAPVLDRRAPRQQAGHRTTASDASVQLHVFRSQLASDGATVCPGNESAPDGSVTGGVGWCLTETARHVTDGMQLTIAACRDTTGGGRLSYSTTREVDLAVQRNGRTVWDWATDHPGTAWTHTRTAFANGCWNWQLVWPGVTQSGAPARHRSFTFVGTTTAEELAGYPPQQVNFRY